MSIEPPPLRWLNAADVAAAMPTLDDQLSLAEHTMTALASPGAAELPPKIGVHPRPDGSAVHAMPAHLRTPGAAADADLVGIKWMAGYATNSALGLPVISGVVVVNDPLTGFPIAILDGGPITAQRTAAVTGVALRCYRPATDRRPPRAALIGAGTQGHSHVPVLGHVLPGVELRLYDPLATRAAQLAEVAARVAGIGSVVVAASARAAVQDADVVVTAASLTTPDASQVMTNDWLAPGATIVPIDLATYCAAEVARGAALFLVDDRRQFLMYRDAGQLDGYPDPTAMLGEAILAGTPRPAGRVVVMHLGVGLADLVFADAILRVAAGRGLGTILPR